MMPYAYYSPRVSAQRWFMHIIVPGFRPDSGLCMLWFGHWGVAPFGTGQLRAHTNTLCYDDDCELCSTICMFYERKMFCEIFSLTY